MKRLPMKIGKTIGLCIVWLSSFHLQAQIREIRLNAFGDSLQHSFSQTFTVRDLNTCGENDLMAYIREMEHPELKQLAKTLMGFKQKNQLDDWLYYQLVRKAAGQLAPKESNYQLYTVFKWYLLTASGYDARLSLNREKILFYVHCEDPIYNIPLRKEEGKQYVCLNYHDYGYLDFQQTPFTWLPVKGEQSGQSFTYRIHHIPTEKQALQERFIHFQYNNQEYGFRLNVNPQLTNYFRNYPTQDYEQHFNIPLSQETYASLIPSLKKKIAKLPPRDGVEFLMHFTRYAFLFKPDTEQFGMEKRFSPELTLLSDGSDCEDRVSLFYYLVKELYDLPMVVLTYPKHVSIAVQFQKSYGSTVEYNGRKFTICDPTPQVKELKIGEVLPSLLHEPYAIAFAYEPSRK
jgi:hypothetical protein